MGLADELGLAGDLVGAVVDSHELTGLAAGQGARDDGHRRAAAAAVAAWQRDARPRRRRGRGRLDPRGGASPTSSPGARPVSRCAAALATTTVAAGDDEDAVAQAVEGERAARCDGSSDQAATW